MGNKGQTVWQERGGKTEGKGFFLNMCISAGSKLSGGIWAKNKDFFQKYIQ